MKNNQSGLIISIVIGFVVIMVLVVVSLSQRQTQEEIQFSAPSQLIDTVKNIEEQRTYQQSNEVRREGYDIDEKPFDERYYPYDERTADFRLVCSAPCPVSKTILEQELAAISYALSTIRGITKTDIKKNLLPFEVHATEDHICKWGIGAAYATSFTDDNGNVRGLLCFFYDRINYNREKFPYETSVHEVVHLFQRERFPRYVGEDRILTEGLSMVLDSFFEKGSVIDSFCWQGNDWFSKQASRTDSVHVKGGSLFFELCKQYGFDYGSLPALFDGLDKLGHTASTREFANIINGIVGADTSHLFREAGVNV